MADILWFSDPDCGVGYIPQSPRAKELFERIFLSAIVGSAGFTFEETFEIPPLQEHRRDG